MELAEIPNKFLFTQRELAKLFDVTPTAVSNWKLNHVAVGDKNSKLYHLPDALEFRLNQITGPRLNLNMEKAKLAVIQQDKTQRECEKLDLDLGVKRGDLLETKIVQQVWQDIAHKVKARILSMPDRLAPQMVGLEDTQQARVLIKSVVEEALHEIKDFAIEDYQTSTQKAYSQEETEEVPQKPEAEKKRKRKKKRRRR